MLDALLSIPWKIPEVLGIVFLKYILFHFSPHIQINLVKFLSLSVISRCSWTFKFTPKWCNTKREYLLAGWKYYSLFGHLGVTFSYKTGVMHSGSHLSIINAALAYKSSATQSYPFYSIKHDVLTCYPRPEVMKPLHQWSYEGEPLYNNQPSSSEATLFAHKTLSLKKIGSKNQGLSQTCTLTN
jgi:hypothetical protein